MDRTGIRGRRSIRSPSMPKTTHLAAQDPSDCESDAYESEDAAESKAAREIQQHSQQAGIRDASPNRNSHTSAKSKPNQPPKASSAVQPEAASPAKKTIRIFLITAVVVSLCGFANWWDEPQPAPTDVKCPFDRIEERFPKQEKCIWHSMSVGVENVINQRTDSPGVYLFVHQGGRHIDGLVKEVAAHAASCFGQQASPSEMPLTDFTSENAIKNYGYTIGQFKQIIRNSHVVIMPTLNDIPAQTALALHQICDTYTPIAKDSIIFLSLIVPPSNDHPIENAEYQLREIWGDVLRQYQLEPLIARITDQVVVLH